MGRHHGLPVHGDDPDGTADPLFSRPCGSIVPGGSYSRRRHSHSWADHMDPVHRLLADMGPEGDMDQLNILLGEGGMHLEADSRLGEDKGLGDLGMALHLALH
jgi:hypothetical protein